MPVNGPAVEASGTIGPIARGFRRARFAARLRLGSAWARLQRRVHRVDQGRSAGVEQILAHLVHHVGETDPGVWVGIGQRAAEARMAEVARIAPVRIPGSGSMKPRPKREGRSTTVSSPLACSV